MPRFEVTVEFRGGIRAFSRFMAFPELVFKSGKSKDLEDVLGPDASNSIPIPRKVSNSSRSH